MLWVGSLSSAIIAGAPNAATGLGRVAVYS